MAKRPWWQSLPIVNAFYGGPQNVPTGRMSGDVRTVAQSSTTKPRLKMKQGNTWDPAKVAILRAAAMPKPPPPQPPGLGDGQGAVTLADQLKNFKFSAGPAGIDEGALRRATQADLDSQILGLSNIGTQFAEGAKATAANTDKRMAEQRGLDEGFTKLVAGLAPSVEGLTPETQAAAQKQAVAQNQTMGLRGQTTGGAMNELAAEQARSAQGTQNAIGAQKNFVQSTFSENFETRKRVAQAAAQQEWENKHASEVAEYTKMMQMAQLEEDQKEALLKAAGGTAADKAYNRKLLEQANIMEGASGQAGDRFGQWLKLYNEAGGVSGSSKRTGKTDASTKASDLLGEAGYADLSGDAQALFDAAIQGYLNSGGTGLTRGLKDAYRQLGKGMVYDPATLSALKNSFYAKSGNLYAKPRRR
jgi:hypothetical protein